MTYIEAKKKLHDYIEHASEEEVMEMATLVETEKTNSRYVFDEESLNMLRERSAEYKAGKAVTYSLEEAMQIIKAQTNINGI
jgi:hypothetical protein